ncbi:hypothetical protein niasHT_022513 [Heterodera trifolii]|uniref:Uncharacterized protein n=1 Tax=Heterodera trifolii TaxID=157864 RepID=A0ABD2JH03_9BILA
MGGEVWVTDPVAFLKLGQIATIRLVRLVTTRTPMLVFPIAAVAILGLRMKQTVAGADASSCANPTSWSRIIDLLRQRRLFP